MGVEEPGSTQHPLAEKEKQIKKINKSSKHGEEKKGSKAQPRSYEV